MGPLGLGDRAGDQGRACRSGGQGRLDRARGREAGALCLRRERVAPRRRPFRCRGRDGLEEPQGGRRARYGRRPGARSQGVHGSRRQCQVDATAASLAPAPDQDRHARHDGRHQRPRQPAHEERP